MKKLIKSAAILAFGFGMAVSFSSCHNGSGDSSTVERTTQIKPKHSIAIVVLDGEGKALNDATVTFMRTGSNPSIATLTGTNTRSYTNLDDGQYTIVVTKNGYKEGSEVFTLAVKNQTVDGKTVPVGQNIEQTFYLIKEESTNKMKLGGSAQLSDEITIETTKQDDGTGTIVNTTDENNQGAEAQTITVSFETPEIVGDKDDESTDLGYINKQIKDQSAAQGEDNDVDDFEVYLTNVTSLEDAKAVARINRVATARNATRATTALPGGYELLAGVGVNALYYNITLPGTSLYPVIIKLPDNDCKNAIRLYRYITGDNWVPMTATDGIASIDLSQDKKVVIYMSRIQTQSFAVGVKINESTELNYEPVVGSEVENPNGSAMAVSSMTYTAKNGVVLYNIVNSSLTDFLRKIVLRKYGTRVVRTPEEVQKTYTFTPAYQLPAYGTLYLVGVQEVKTVNYTIENATAAFRSTEYGNSMLNPYAVYPLPIDEHTGGSN